MPDELAGAPFAAIFAFFFAVAFIRTLVTYWVARFVAGLTIDRTQPQRPVLVRAQTWSRSRAAQQGTAFINRWGVLAVPLSFLTVGVQTFVQISAGVTRMPLRRYLPAVALGSAIWALIYGSIGMAVILAWLETGGHWPPVLLLLAVVTALVVMHRRRRRPANPGSKSRTVSSPSG